VVGASKVVVADVVAATVSVTVAGGAEVVTGVVFCDERFAESELLGRLLWFIRSTTATAAIATASTRIAPITPRLVPPDRLGDWADLSVAAEAGGLGGGAGVTGIATVGWLAVLALGAPAHPSTAQP
jgi:hypothetical protein